MDSFPHISGSGIFQHHVRMARPDLLFCPSAHFTYKRDKRILQPLLRQRAALRTAGQTLWSFPQEGYSKVDEKQMVPIRVFNLLFRNVFSDALEYLSGIFRHSGPGAGRDTSVDL